MVTVVFAVSLILILLWLVLFRRKPALSLLEKPKAPQTIFRPFIPDCLELSTTDNASTQKYHKRHINELPKVLRVAATFIIGSCLGWFVLVSAGLITFLFLFIRVASMVLPEILAHLP